MGAKRWLKKPKGAGKCHVPESFDPTRGQNMELTFCNWQVFKTITQEIKSYKDEVSFLQHFIMKKLSTCYFYLPPRSGSLQSRTLHILQILTVKFHQFSFFQFSLIIKHNMASCKYELSNITLNMEYEWPFDIEQDGIILAIYSCFHGSKKYSWQQQ